MRPACLVLLSLFAFAGVARADDFDADRPDFTNSPRALPAGRWQLEMGATRVRLDGLTAITAGEGDLRFGIRQSWELHVALPTWNRLASDGQPGSDGFGDAGVGCKYTLPGANETQAFGVLADVTLPTGARGIGGDRAGGDLLLGAEHTLGTHANLGLNAGWTRQSGTDGGVASASLGLDLGSGLGSWLECALASAGGSTAERFDGGLTLQVAHWTQLDARVGVGAGDARGEVTFGAGIAQRW